MSRTYSAYTLCIYRNIQSRNLIKIQSESSSEKLDFANLLDFTCAITKSNFNFDAVAVERICQYRERGSLCRFGHQCH